MRRVIAINCATCIRQDFFNLLKYWPRFWLVLWI